MFKSNQTNILLLFSLLWIDFVVVLFVCFLTRAVHPSSSLWCSECVGCSVVHPMLPSEESSKGVKAALLHHRPRCSSPEGRLHLLRVDEAKDAKASTTVHGGSLGKRACGLYCLSSDCTFAQQIHEFLFIVQGSFDSNSKIIR